MCYLIVLTGRMAACIPDALLDDEARIEPNGAPLARAAAARLAASDPAGPSVVTWNGSLPPGGSATVTVEALIEPHAPGGPLSLQGAMSFDSDADGVNDETLVTDDPEAEGEEDPTVLVIEAPQVLEIPTASHLGLAILGLLLAAAARRRLGRPRLAP